MISVPQLYIKILRNTPESESLLGSKMERIELENTKDHGDLLLVTGIIKRPLGTPIKEIRVMGRHEEN